MDNNNDQNEHNSDSSSGLFAGLMFLAGLLLGGLVGAGAMLLLAPQSGKRTRTQIRRKSRDLREQATETMEVGVHQVRAQAHKVTNSIHDQAEDMRQRG